MGEVLKQKYEQRDFIKALTKIDLSINEEYQKLSDKYKNLKLSHNRKYKLLEKLEKFLKILQKEKEMDGFMKEYVKDLLFKINGELTFIGGVRKW